MEAYRLYDPENPLHYCTTVAYVEDLEKARQHNIPNTITIEDD